MEKYYSRDCIPRQYHLELSNLFRATSLFLEIIYKSAIARVSWSEHYSVLRCSSRKGERNLRLEAEGKMPNDKESQEKVKVEVKTK